MEHQHTFGKRYDMTFHFDTDEIFLTGQKVKITSIVSFLNLHDKILKIIKRISTFSRRTVDV